MRGKIIISALLFAGNVFGQLANPIGVEQLPQSITDLTNQISSVTNALGTVTNDLTDAIRYSDVQQSINDSTNPVSGSAMGTFTNTLGELAFMDIDTNAVELSRIPTLTTNQLDANADSAYRNDDNWTNGITRAAYGDYAGITNPPAALSDSWTNDLGQLAFMDSDTNLVPIARIPSDVLVWTNTEATLSGTAGVFPDSSGVSNWVSSLVAGLSTGGSIASNDIWIASIGATYVSAAATVTPTLNIISGDWNRTNGFETIGQNEHFCILWGMSFAYTNSTTANSDIGVGFSYQPNWYANVTRRINASQPTAAKATFLEVTGIVVGYNTVLSQKFFPVINNNAGGNIYTMTYGGYVYAIRLY
jgi:uncharacterized membrane protein